MSSANQIKSGIIPDEKKREKLSMSYVQYEEIALE